MHTSQLIETMMGGAVLGFAPMQEGAAAPAQAGGAESATSGALGGTTVTGADGSTTQGAAQGQGGAAGGGGGMSMMLLFMVPVLIFLIFTSVMGGRKEKKKRAEMMSSLKKHDKVQTIGGIIGTVVELGPEEVLLETGKSRIRFSRTAIQQVLRGGPASASSAGGDEQETDAGANNGVVEKVGV